MCDVFSTFRRIDVSHQSRIISSFSTTSNRLQTSHNTQLTHLDHHPTTPNRTMEVSSTQNLYPVVQDLTDAEYGGNCCCADIEFGNFSLKDLVMPAVSPRPLPNISPISSPSHSRGKSLGLLRPPPAVSPLLSSAASASASPKSKSKSHRRSNTLGILKLGAATTESYLFKGHCRSYSSPSTIISETGDSTTVTCEAEERVTDSVKFDEVYVLTRQVSTRHLWPLKIISRNVSHSFISLYY